MPTDRDEHITLIEDCEHRESKLSDWERNFIDSIQHHLKDPGYRLSKLQAATLEEIWERVT